MANRSFISGQNVSLYIDASDLQKKIAIYRDALSEKGFEKLMNRTFNEVGRRMRTPIAREAVEKYKVTQAWVKSQMGSPQISLGPNPSVAIKLKGVKGSIGGKGRFKANVRKRGKVKGKSVQGKIVADIVKTNKTILPDTLPNQGGNPPFMANGVTFTRRGPGRLPIVAVKGLAVPQMPLNRAASETQDAILKIADERLEHNFQYMFGKT